MTATKKQNDKSSGEQKSQRSGGSQKESTKKTARQSQGSKKVFEDFLLKVLKDVLHFAKDEVVISNWHRLKKNIKLAHKTYSGETVAILGPPASGKTTLLKLLGNQNIPQELLLPYSKTELEIHKSISAKYKLNIGADENLLFRFKLRKNSDVGGEIYLRDQHWKDVIKDAAIVIYMIDSTMFIQDGFGINQDHAPSEYQNRIISDFDWIRDNHQLLHEKFSVVLAFNKIDKLCDVESYRNFSNEHQRFIESLKEKISCRWPDHLIDHLKGGLFLSVLDPALRAFTMNGLMSCFVGDDLMKILKEGAQEA